MSQRSERVRAFILAPKQNKSSSPGCINTSSKLSARSEMKAPLKKRLRSTIQIQTAAT